MAESVTLSLIKYITQEQGDKIRPSDRNGDNLMKAHENKV